MRRGERQLFLVRLPGEARVESRDHYDTTRTKSRHKITIHRVLIDVDLDLAHVADQRHRFRVTAPRPHLGQPLTIADRLECPPMRQMDSHAIIVIAWGGTAAAADGSAICGWAGGAEWDAGG